MLVLGCVVHAEVGVNRNCMVLLEHEGVNNKSWITVSSSACSGQTQFDCFVKGPCTSCQTHFDYFVNFPCMFEANTVGLLC